MIGQLGLRRKHVNKRIKKQFANNRLLTSKLVCLRAFFPYSYWSTKQALIEESYFETVHKKNGGVIWS